VAHDSGASGGPVNSKTPRYLKADRRLRIVQAMLEYPEATPAQLADIAQCKRGHVGEVLRDIQYRLECRAEELLDEYQHILMQALPLEVRADHLAKIAAGGNPSAAMRAIEHADKVAGLLSEKVTLSNPDGSPLLAGIKIIEVGDPDVK